MKSKSILMPHACQKVGWCLVALSLISFIVNVLFFRHNIDGAWYLAKTAHFTALLAFFFLCLSKEKVEDEMISAYRLKAAGITGYAFFVFFMLLSIVLELRPGFLFAHAEDTLSAYLSEFFLIELPLLLFIVYFLTFKVLLVKSKIQ
jgi:hypothetical protein